jgi:hypothetical protein
MRVVSVALVIGLFGFAAATVRTLTVAAEPPQQPDYYPMATRKLKLTIEYPPVDRKLIRQVQLYASRDQGQTWALESTVTPDREYFAYVAKDDGIYWFNVVVVYTDGAKDPPDVTRAGPAQKLLVDATPPVVRIASAARAGDDITVEWTVEEKFPNPAKTALSYRPVGGTEGDWKTVPLTGADPKAARFNPNTNAPLLVRVSAEDLAGNAHSATKEIAGLTTSAFHSPADQPKPAAGPPAGAPLAPPSLELVAPQLVPAAPAAPPGPPAPLVDLTSSSQPPATLPHSHTSPEPAAGPAPIASGSGTPPLPAAAPAIAPATATPEPPPAQIINFTRFELPYQLEAGPSGVRQVDLYVTRDDGRSWVKWSQHDGKEVPLKVNLESRLDARPDGTYGFKLVAMSGAGLCEEPPRPGTPPDLRVQVDTVPPLISIYQPEADPANREVLVLRWSVTDKNLGKDPVALEWSEHPTGPWRPVTAGDSLVPVAAGQSPAGPQRVANTGRFAWKIPPNLPTHLVYLKVTAWDAAGNKSEIATDKPILVDLVKPRARIQGILPAQTRP